MNKINLRVEKHFLEIMVGVLVQIGLSSKEEATSKLEERVYELSEEDIELRDIPEVVTYIYEAGCIPGDIIRNHKLGYCKRIIEAYKKIIQETYKNADAFILFKTYSKYIQSEEAAISPIKKIRK